MAAENVIALEAGAMRAEISPRGAELVRLCHDGQDLLWSGEGEVWNQHAPVLFPVIGRVVEDRIRVAGRSFPMPMHGFAMGARFTPLRRDAAHCELLLRDSPATLAQYPFPFRLRIAFALDAAGLHVTATLGNPGATALPASLGFHPGLRWPLEPDRPRDAHRLRFPAGTVLTVARPVDRLLPPGREALTPPNGILPLHDALFERGGLVLLGLQNRSLRYEAAGGGRAVTLAFPDFPNLTLWTRPGAGFLCLEPWFGHPDPLGFAGEFADKPGAALIPPHRERRFRWSLRVENLPRSPR